jgi:hypothetical protein
VIRTGVDPLGMAAAVKREILSVDSEHPIFYVRSLEQVTADSISGQKFQMIRETPSRVGPIVKFAKIPIFSKHWTSLLTPHTDGSIVHTLLTFISSPVSIFKLRRDLALENPDSHGGSGPGAQ